MNSEDIPQKLENWLFLMGCPPEDIPPLDKIKQMCRGQYYMVWNNLLTRVQSAQVVKDKRLQVFCDDVKKCDESKGGHKDIYTPEQLILWRQNNEKKHEVSLAENRVSKLKQQFDNVTGKLSNKMSQRTATRRRCEDVHRRVWILHNLSTDLSKRRESLLTTKDIAHTLKPVVQQKEVDVDKCLSVLSKNVQTNKPADSISIASLVSDSVESDIEDKLQMLISNGGGGGLWTELSKRRAALVEKLSTASADVTQKAGCSGLNRLSSKAVLSDSYALYTFLKLDTLRNRIQIKNMHESLTGIIGNFDNVVASDARELLVLRCERARADARAAALRTQHESLVHARGVFQMHYYGDAGSPEAVRRRILKIHRDMESKYDNLKKLLSALSKTEMKICNVRDSLQTIFRGFQKELPAVEFDLSQTLTPVQIGESQNVAALRLFYENKLTEQTQKPDCSMDFNMSETLVDVNKESKPNFIDELKFYLNNFKLERNLMVVLDNGETLWIFETLRELLQKYEEKFNSAKAGLNLCTVTSVASNLSDLKESIDTRHMERMIKEMFSTDKQTKQTVLPDITAKVESAEKTLDSIKKVSAENISKLQKVKKIVQISQDNLKFWEDNNMKNYISSKRTIDGKTYQQYEALYADCFKTL